MPEYLWLVVVGSFAAFAFGWGTGGIAPANTQVGVGLGLRPFDAFGDSLPVCGSLLAREYMQGPLKFSSRSRPSLHLGENVERHVEP